MKRGLIPAVVAACLMFAGCAAQAESEQAPPPSPSATQATETPVPEVVDVAALCAERAADDAESGAVGAAIGAADFPEGIVLSPGVQVIHSVDVPDGIEVVVRVCGEGLDRDALISAGNVAARAVYEIPEGESVQEMVVSGWEPAGDSLDRVDGLDSIRTEYQLYLWDTTARPLDGNWQ